MSATFLVVCHVLVQAPSKEAAIEAAGALLSVGLEGASENVGGSVKFPYVGDAGVEFHQAYAHSVGARS